MDIIVQNAIQAQFESSEQFPVDFDVFWEWVGYTRKDNAKRAFENSEFEKGIDYELLIKEELRPQGGFSNREIIKLTIDCAKSFAMMAKTEQGKEVRKYYLECEKIAKSTAIAPKPKSTADMLLESALAFKEHETRICNIEAENIELKKQLAAQKVETEKQLAAQKVEIDDNASELERFKNGHGTYFSIAGWCAKHGFRRSLDWMNAQGRKAASLCKAKGIKKEQVPDPRWGHVGAYPDTVLSELAWNDEK